MRLTMRWGAAGLAAVTLSACSPTAGKQPVSSSDPHADLITPGSDALFNAESAPPDSDEGWRDVGAAAQKVAEGARLLQTGAHVRDTGDWLRLAKAVEEGALKSVSAAKTKDPDALLLADGEFLALCEDCHKIYRDAGGGMMASPDK